jgi:hypothetical protein
MSRCSGTYEATAVTTRRWFGIQLATWAMWATFVLAVLASIFLFREMSGSRASHVSDMELRFLAWSYAFSPPSAFVHPLIAYAYPPISLWVGVVMFVLSAGSVATDSQVAIRTVRGHRIGVVWGSERRMIRNAAENLRDQLHARGRAGLFGRGRGTFVRLGFGLVGAGMVLATALLAPMSLTSSGETIPNIQNGMLPTVCLVGSLVALVGVLLAFPFGPTDRIVVDVSGNVRGADEPVVLPALPAPTTGPEPAIAPTSGFPSSPAPVTEPVSPLASTAPTIAFCPRCGTRRISGEPFCSGCGAALYVYAPQPPTSEVLEPSLTGVAGSPTADDPRRA